MEKSKNLKNGRPKLGVVSLSRDLPTSRAAQWLGDARWGRRKTCRFVLLGWLLSIASISVAQDVSVVSNSAISGVVRDLAPGMMTIVDDLGVAKKLRIQNKSEAAVILGGRRIRYPAAIKVTGTLSRDLLDLGMVVEVTVPTNANGKTQGDLKTLKVLEFADAKLDHRFEQTPDGGKDFQRCRITGRTVSLNRNKLQLAIPDSNLNRKQVVSLSLAADATLQIEDDKLDRVIAGDRVVRATVAQFSTGEFAVKNIEIELVAPRQQVTHSFHDQLAQRFSHLSDEPLPPRELRSDHFLLYTDISDRSAQVLLAKLEVMHDLVGQYFRAKPTQPVVCFVVRDLKQWPTGRLPARGVAKIAEKAGVTLYRTQRSTGFAEAAVYSCADHGICQHEAVHAFCALTFGGTGPVWFAEGMAEMGQYWTPGEKAVNIDSFVIRYLQNAEPKKMAAIVAAGQITGDSWQAYAWRWALCHLLANNPNYAKRFKQLGLNLMNDRKDDSFTNAFGPVAEHISFEYDQFVQNFGNGYRVDLCVWDWETPAKKLSASGRSKTKVVARGGWQATRLWCNPDQSYDHVAEGNWGLGKGTEELTANGSPTGEGKLIGAVLNNFLLSEPFELGVQKTWTAPAEGQLYLRCRDAWTKLADNSGELKVTFRRTPK